MDAMTKKGTKKVAKRVTTETVDDEGNKKTVIKEHAPKRVKKKRKKSTSIMHPKHHSMSISDNKKKMTAREREELLIENFVGLQHAMTNMSIKFGSLSDNISKLLQVFEESAKNFVSGGRPDDEEMLKKIDSLLNQNKTIAKGLVLMEGKLRGRTESHAPAPSVPPRIERDVRPPVSPPPSSPSSAPLEFKGPKPLPSI